MRVNGKVELTGDLGDWAKKYDKMGDVPEVGRLERFEAEAEAGVRRSGGEPSELDEPEETETERPRRTEVFIAMGSECLTKSDELVLLEDILYRLD